MDDVAAEIGVRPSLCRLFLTDPSLALRCFLGPCTAAQYRLHGPGAWSGAKEAIQNALSNDIKSTWKRQEETLEEDDDVKEENDVPNGITD